MRTRESLNTSLAQGEICCDVCRSNSENINDQMIDVTEEVLTLLAAINFLGLKRELEIVQWTRGCLDIST